MAGRRRPARARHRAAGDAPRARVSLAVALTVLVAAVGFALLVTVYYRAGPVRAQRITVAAIDGQARSVQSGAAAQALASDSQAAAARLETQGVGASTLAQLRQAASALSAHPDDGDDLTSLQGATASLAQVLGDRQHVLDEQDESIYAILLALASVGWFGWFRRTTRRDRGGREAATEPQLPPSGERRLAAIVRHAVDVVAVCDLDSRISFATPSSMAVLGLNHSDLIGRRYSEFVHSEDAHLIAHLLDANRRAGQTAALQLRMRHADGHVIYVEGTVTNLLSEPSVGGFVLTIRDITERVDFEARLQYQAFYDSLTELSNRQLFSDRLAHALLRREGVERPLVVMICDLDDFKNVNASFGHNVGDQVLAEIGWRLRSVIRGGDTAARLGSDEFAILMEATELSAGRAIAERLQAALAEPVVIDNQRLAIRASIGLAQAVPGEMTGEEALRNADVAMYLAKDRGKSKIEVYESPLHSEALERMQLRADLQRALRRNEFVLHYQPIVDLHRGGIIGFEALVRWQHPIHGLIPPLRFVPMAEETGLILPLGSWVLRAACRAVATLQAPGQQLSISVNVSYQQLVQPAFVNEVMAILAETGLNSRRLILEVTESVLMRDPDAVGPRLRVLRDLGLRIAIDDFGSGENSFGGLSELPIDMLKVDKTFIDRVAVDQHDASAAEAIITLSHALNVTTVAVGVETVAQAGWLAAAGCTYGQGYLWSRPVGIEQARGLLRDQSSARPRRAAVTNPPAPPTAAPLGLSPAQPSTAGAI